MDVEQESLDELAVESDSNQPNNQLDKPPIAWNHQDSSIRLFGYIVVTLVAIIIIIMIINAVMANFDFYTSDSGFPNVFLFFFGTLAIFLLYAYCTFYITENEHGMGWRYMIAFWSWLTFLVAYVMVVVNLDLRTEKYIKGQMVGSNGGEYAVLAIIAVLGSMIAAGQDNPKIILSLAIVLVWTMYILYSWTFKTGNSSMQMGNRR